MIPDVRQLFGPAKSIAHECHWQLRRLGSFTPCVSMCIYFTYLPLGSSKHIKIYLPVSFGEAHRALAASVYICRVWTPGTKCAKKICFDKQTHAVMHLTRSSTRVKSLGLVDKIDVLYITSGFFGSLVFKTEEVLLLMQEWLYVWHLTHMTRSKYAGTIKFEEEATAIYLTSK